MKKASTMQTPPEITRRKWVDVDSDLKERTYGHGVLRGRCRLQRKLFDVGFPMCLNNVNVNCGNTLSLID